MQFNDDYYLGVIKKYHYNPIDFLPINFNIGVLDAEVLQKKWLCHYKGNEFAEGIRKGEKSIITTGVGLSGTPHIGTLSQILRAIFLQKTGLNVQFVLGDLDSYNARNQSLDVLRQRVQQYSKFISQLGFDTNKGVLRKQEGELKVHEVAYLISKYLTDNDFLEAEEDLSDLYQKKKVYPGIEFPVKQSILLMTADFLSLAMRDGYENILVMVGLEEHLYVRLAQKVIERMKLPVRFGAVYSKIIKGLNGYPKMSKSLPGSSITVDMSKEEMTKLIMNEKDSSNPEESVVYQMMCSVSYYSAQDLEDIKKVYGNDKWVEYKRNYCNMLYDICKKWS